MARWRHRHIHSCESRLIAAELDPHKGVGAYARNSRHDVAARRVSAIATSLFQLGGIVGSL